jgi:hypothetical protein
MQIFDNGTVVNDNNLISIGIDPGVQDQCADKVVAIANITSMGDVTIIDVKQNK